ncbi:MAG: cadmium-translocating P-type ATPase [Alphaproteobacteria bacterium]|nr:cadmium-translocating P-type ATPase [Alphaproteobacteria bacterium]
MEQLAVSDPFRVRGQLDAANVETGYQNLVKKNDDGALSLNVIVSGVHCAACIQKIEGTLKAQDDIESVRLNFSSGQLAITWKGNEDRANDFAALVEGLGYGVKPFDPSTYDTAQKKEERFLLLCLGVAGFALGNIMLLSVGVWSTSAETMGGATRDFLHWISAIIALPTIVFSGRPFFRSALKALSKAQTNMDVPISLAILLASGMSLFEVINHGEHVFFDSAVMLTFFLLVGRFLDFKARQSARSSANDLLKSVQGFATVIEGGKTSRVLIKDLQEGMIVAVPAGETIPADGEIIEGRSTIDTSLITGETLPQDVEKNAYVHAGTLNLSAPLKVQVAKAADDTLLADIVKLMDQAGQSQAAYVQIADKAARLYTPVVHVMAIAAFCGWFFLAGMAWQDALLIAVTVLIITCPCALGLAVPVVQVLSIARLMKKGIFVKSGDALERLSSIDTAVFDKTGTLTYGELRIVGPHNPQSLQVAASLAAASSHPVSRGLVNSFAGELLQVDDIREIEGCGLSGVINDQPVKLGSRAWCGDEKAPASDHIEIWFETDSANKTRFLLTDVVREDAAQTVEKFDKAGVGSMLLSGDQKQIVDAVADKVGIEKRMAQYDPAQKFREIQALQNDGHKVLMVGDGLNDAPVLSQADVSIAPGTAIDLAQQSADIVFLGDKLSSVYEAYALSQTSQKLVLQNFALAVIYNLVAVPLAVAGMVTPLVAALAMSGSSLLVIANSFRIKFFT